MRKSTDVAVVIPVYNGANFIERAVKSVLAQTTEPAEIVVVDDCSFDDTTAIVRSISKSHPTVKLVVQPANRGPSAARNAGVDATNSGLIAFLDADDSWFPNHLELLVETWEALDGPDVVTAVAFQATEPSIERSANEIADPVLALLRSNFVLQSAVLIKRGAFLNVGGFASDLRFSEDYDLWLRMAIAGARFVKLNVPTCIKHGHDGQASVRHADRMYFSAWKSRARVVAQLGARGSSREVRELLRDAAILDRKAALATRKQEVLKAACEATSWVGLAESEERYWRRRTDSATLQMMWHIYDQLPNALRKRVQDWRRY